MVYTDPVSQSATPWRGWSTITRCRSGRAHAQPAAHPAGLGRSLGEAASRQGTRRAARREGSRRSSPVPLAARDVSGFEQGLAKISEETDVIFAVENMFPIRAGASRGLRLRAALGPDRAGRPQRHPRPVAHRRVRVGRDRDGERTRHQARARAPGRRHRVSPARCPTSTWCPAGAGSPAPSSCAASPPPAIGAWWSPRSTPGAPQSREDRLRGPGRDPGLRQDPPVVCSRSADSATRGTCLLRDLQLQAREVKCGVWRT